MITQSHLSQWSMVNGQWSMVNGQQIIVPNKLVVLSLFLNYYFPPFLNAFVLKV